MKKLALSLICLFTIALSQDDMNDDMGMKVYIGASSMSASYDTDFDIGRKNGLNFGLMKPINDKTTFGFGYTNRGYLVDIYDEMEVNITGFELWATYNLFDLANGGNFWVGPSFAILTEGDIKYNSYTDDFNIDDNDLSLMFGISFPFASNSINLGYQRSLTKVNDDIIFNQFFIDYSFGL